MVQVALPHLEVVRAAGDDAVDVRHLLLVEHLVDALADPEQPVLVAAGDVQQPQLLGRLRVVLDEVGGPLGVRGGREPADPGERVEVAQPEVERLPAAHRQPGHGPRLSRSAFTGVRLLDERDQVGEQVLLERGERRRLLGNRVSRRHVLRRPAVGHDDDHRHRLLVGVQVVEDHVRHAAPRPTRSRPRRCRAAGTAPGTSVLRVARRRVDLRLPLHADRRRVVLDRLQLAALDAVPLLVVVFRRGGKLPGLASDFGCPGWACSDPVVYASTAHETSARIRPFMHHPPAIEYGGKPYHTRNCTQMRRKLSIRRRLRLQTGTATFLRRNKATTIRCSQVK